MAENSKLKALRDWFEVAKLFPEMSEKKAAEIEEACSEGVKAIDQVAAAKGALIVLRHGLSAKCMEEGEFWTARTWLKKRGIYEGDLTGERVLLEVAKQALKELA